MFGLMRVLTHKRLSKDLYESKIRLESELAQCKVACDGYRRIADGFIFDVMTPKEFAARMVEIGQDTMGDWERMHRDQDHLLLEVLRGLGYGDGCDVFERTTKWHA